MPRKKTQNPDRKNHYLHVRVNEKLLQKLDAIQLPEHGRSATIRRLIAEEYAALERERQHPPCE